MEQTELQKEIAPFSEEERAHAKSALILTAFVALITVISILLAIYKADPSGVYVYAYTVSANGERENGRNVELHLKKGGIVTYVSAVSTSDGTNVRMNGSWKKDGNKIILIFQGEKTVFYRSGNKLIEKFEDGSKNVYIKDK